MAGDGITLDEQGAELGLPGMNPAAPPFPLATKRPFQPEIGIQTSTRMFESAVGVNVIAPRQKAESAV